MPCNLAVGPRVKARVRIISKARVWTKVRVGV